ncbi:MAG: hypothetical protein O2968_19740, partial [Acidobacteria bacterium]|nr:hypothetical protein [Acidobacteriota bacterium]
MSSASVRRAARTSAVRNVLFLESMSCNLKLRIAARPEARANESCPMQDDPERRECFQYKMILK